MSRSGYAESGDYDFDQWAFIRWSGALASTLRGRRGQAFLRELLAALDALPQKRLVAEVLEAGGEVCALGAMGRARGTDMSSTDPEDPSSVAGLFGVNEKLARELMYQNDESGPRTESPEQRFTRVRAWVVGRIKSEVSP